MTGAAVTAIINEPGFMQNLMNGSGLQRAIGGVFLLWFIVILWVIKDISQRTNNLFLEVVSVLMVVVFTPILGLPLYFAIRPVRYKFDKMPWREALSMSVIECQSCGGENNVDYEHCVFCGDKLKITCKECKTQYPASYGYCFKCGAPNINV